MANAAFDAWVVKFLIAVNNYNTNVGEWNAKGETKRLLNRIKHIHQF